MGSDLLSAILGPDGTSRSNSGRLVLTPSTPEELELVVTSSASNSEKLHLLEASASSLGRNAPPSTVAGVALSRLNGILDVDAPNRVASVQALLENGKGEVRFHISPKCEKLIECLELQSYTEKGDPDKESGYDHMNDGLGYLIWREFNPLHMGSGRGTGIRIY